MSNRIEQAYCIHVLMPELEERYQRLRGSVERLIGAQVEELSQVEWNRLELAIRDVVSVIDLMLPASDDAIPDGGER